MDRMRRALGVGTWRPAILTSGDVLTLKGALGCAALLRAADYGVAAVRPGHGDAIEQALPAVVWASVCATVGLLLLSGITFRVHWAVFSGHFLGAVTYAALAVGAFQRAFSMVPPDEWRRGSALIVIALIHWLFAMRSGPTPISDCEERPSEVVVAPTDA